MADLTEFLTDKFNTEVKRPRRPHGCADDESASAPPTAASTQRPIKSRESVSDKPLAGAVEVPPQRAGQESRSATRVTSSAAASQASRDKPAAAAYPKTRPEKSRPVAGAAVKPLAQKGRRTAQVVERQNIRSMSMRTEWTPSELRDRGLVYAGMPDQAVLNAYRELRTKLMQASAGANFVCMVSSLSRDASATAVAANLAASIAIDKTKTAVLIDCDLNGPGTEQYTVVRATRGVTDYLDDPSLELTQIIYPSGVHRLRVIPLGNSVEHSAEHFASRSMYRFISSVKTRYPDRFVIVIAPPIATSAEAKILTETCDLAVLVMPYGKVVESQLQAATSMVPEHKLAGIVCPPEQ